MYIRTKLDDAIRYIQEYYIVITACIILSTSTFHIIKESFGLHDLFLLPSLLIASVLTLLLTGDQTKSPRKLNFPHLLLPFIILTLLGYYKAVMGNIDLTAVMFHLQVGMGHLSPDLVGPFVIEGRKFALGILAFLIGSLILLYQSTAYKKAEFLLAMVFYAFLLGAFLSQRVNLFQQEVADFTAEYRVPSPVPQAGSSKKNFIHVYLESTERTYMRSELFGDVMDPLKPFIERGFEATNLVQVRDTGWSLAGMTASKCGVPLSPAGFSYKNKFGSLSGFLPSAVCLGDVLLEEDYNLTFLVGAFTRFGGLDTLYSTHGFSQVLDLDHFLKKHQGTDKLEHHKQAWGVSDELVFEEALEVLKQKVRAGKKFGLTIETIGGHAPIGLLSPVCENMEQIMQQRVTMLSAMKCTNWLLADFISKSEKLGLLEDTVIIVQNDHLAMKNSVYSELQSSERRNLFFVFGPDIRAGKTDKPASLLDVYPTVLEAIGLPLKNSRAGLGVSLFSEEPTLVETLGEDDMNKSIALNYELRKHLWSHPSN